MKKKHRILPLLLVLTLIFSMFANTVAAEQNDASGGNGLLTVGSAADGKNGIDYGADVIVTGKINEEYNSGYCINLTDETLTVPADYNIAAYSIDGGVRWTVLGTKPFGNANLVSLLSQNFTLAFTDKYDKNRKPTADATVVKFAAVKKRPRMTAYIVNYSIGADTWGMTAGTWVLTTAKGTKSIKEGIEIAVANASGKAPDSDGFGRFYGQDGSTDGIEIAALTESGKAVKTSYFIRKGASANSNGTYTAASESTKIVVEGQSKPQSYSVDKNKKVISYPANTYIYKDGYNAPELNKTKGALDISNYTGDVYLWKAATATAPASAMQKTTVTTDGNNITTANETVAALFTSGIAPNASSQNSPSQQAATANFALFSVTSVALDTTSMTLPVSATRTVTATVTAAQEDDTTVMWSSTQPTIATVDSTGKITAVGEGTATITATSVADPTKTAPCTVKVVPKFEITSPMVSSGVVNSPYSYTPSVSTYTDMPAVTWSISGALPLGLIFNNNSANPNYGDISGTPTRTGTSEVVFTAAVTIDGVRYTDTLTLTITIEQAYTSPVILTATIPECLVGREYRTQLFASGYPSPKWTVVDGSLPAGLTLDENTGVISGTPLTPITPPEGNQYAFIIMADNGVPSETPTSGELPANMKKYTIDLVQTYLVKFSVPKGNGTLSVLGQSTNGAENTVLVREDDPAVIFTATANQGYRILNWTLNSAVKGEPMPEPDTTKNPPVTPPTPNPLTKVKEATYELKVKNGQGETGDSIKTNAIKTTEPPSVTITVEFEEVPTYIINFEVIGGEDKGTLTATKKTGGVTTVIEDGNSVFEDDIVSFLAKPTDPVNWTVKEWKVDNKELVGETGKFEEENPSTPTPPFTGTTFVLSDLIERNKAGFQKTIKVTVEFMTIPKYAVTFNAPDGRGTITATVRGRAIASNDFVLQHEDIVFTATPNEGYRVAKWTLTNPDSIITPPIKPTPPNPPGTPPDANNKTNTYTLVKLIGTAHIEVTFELITPHSVTFEVKPEDETNIKRGYVTAKEVGKTAELTNGERVNEGRSVEFTAYPNEGYRVKTWEIINEDSTTNPKTSETISTNRTTHTVSNIKFSIKVVVTFEKTPSVLVESVTISPAAPEIGQKGSRTLTAAVSPANVTNKTVEWTIEIIYEKDEDDNPIPNPDLGTVRSASGRQMVWGNIPVTANGQTIYVDYASVNQDGKVSVTEHAPVGTEFKVIATPVSDGVKDYKKGEVTVEVTPYIAVTDVELSEKQPFDMIANSEKTLTATVYPSNAVNKDLTWKSSNETVAAVDANGKITALSKGTAIITAASVDVPAITSTVTVTVTEPLLTFSPDISSKTFTSLMQGYGQTDTESDSLEVIISNSGSASGDLTVTLAGMNPRDFMLNGEDVQTATVPNIITNGIGSFTVYPKTGLATGLHTATLTIANASGNTLKTITLSFSVSPALPATPPSITALSTLDSGMVGVPYSETLTATGSVPMTWDITAGTLPPGLNMNKSGVISGSPSTKNKYMFTVKATNAHGSDTKQISITIDAPVVVTGVVMNTSAASIAVGASTTLVGTITPSDAANKNVSWSSSDSSIASVDANGKVTGIKVGKATITVRTADGGKTATCAITVTTATAAAGGTEVTGLTLNKTTLTLPVGGSGVLTPIISPNNATTKAVRYESTNPTVVAVNPDTGDLYALKEGTSLITATSREGNKAATCMVTVTNFPVTGAAMNKTATTMKVGDTDTLTVNITPANAGNKAVIWSSNNITIATVDQNGKITAKAPGTANIIATTVDGNKPATCTVTVTGIPATGITMKSSTTIAVGGSETLVVTFTPADTSNKTLTWTSDNTAVAVVDSAGKITAKANGTAAVTAKTADGKTAICSVTVKNTAVTGITMKASTTIAVGSSEVLTATLAPANATNKTIQWSSSNTSVASVDANGKVSGVAAGIATITASTADGGKTAVCTVTVEVGYSIISGQATGGTATSSHAKATAGTRVTLTATSYEGYYFVGWQVVPADVTVNGNKFTMPAANVTVTPVFKQILTLGSYINPANIDTRNASHTITFTGSQLLNGSAGICLPGTDLANIASKNSSFIIELATPFGSYQIPAKLASLIPDLNNILAKNNLKIEGVGFNIIISDKSGDKAIANALANSMPKAKIIGSPVDFTIEIVKMVNGKPGAVIGTVGDNLTERITRLIPLPQTVKTLPEYWGAFRYNEASDKLEFVPHTTRVLNDTLYVIVNSASNSVYLIAENPVTFDDVKANAWYMEYISKAASKRLVQGVGNGLYQPERKLTRAEFVQMMVTALQLPKAKTGTKGYSDVTGDWYYDSIMRAKSAGLLDKFPGNTFSPTQAITREEMAVILAAVIRYEKFTVTGWSINLKGIFKDYGSFNPNYAADVEIIYRLKIMEGMGNGLFSPKGTTTRAQAATVQVRLLEMLKLID